MNSISEYLQSILNTEPSKVNQLVLDGRADGAIAVQEILVDWLDAHMLDMPPRLFEEFVKVLR